MNPKVYIILVNYNGWKDTVECLESLLKLSFQNFQIVIIDNSPGTSSVDKICQWASTGLSIETNYIDLVMPSVEKPIEDFVQIDESEILKDHHSSKILLVKARNNKGFSHANNIGLKYALSQKGMSYAWLLNNDTVVARESLRHLVDTMDQGEKDIGILGAKVMEYDNAAMIQSAGGGKILKPFMYSRLIGAGQEDNGQFDVKDIKLDFVAGTSMFVRKTFLEEIGLLSEDYFLYFEEPDLSERAQSKNWRLGYCYSAKIHHKGGATTGGKGYSAKAKTSTAFSDYYFQRAKVLFAQKYYWYWLPTLYLSFAFVIFNRIRRGQFERISRLLRILLYPHRTY